MKVYIVRKVETDESMSICPSEDVAEMEVDRFYLFLDVECYVSIEIH